MDALVEGMDSGAHPPQTRKRVVLKVASMLLWGMILAFAAWLAFREPSAANFITAAALLVLFVAVNAQVALTQWAHHRGIRSLTAKLHGTGYISELGGLPNRNYLLSELRREMPRARNEGTPFTLIVFSLDNLDEIKERRGADFVDRAVHGAVETLRRVTRNSDFLAHLGGARFCVLLVECGKADSFNYLRRVPGSVPVSDGRHMYDVPFTARLAQYDMESMYATDVLAEAEDAKPLKRKAGSRPDARAA